MEKYLIVKVGGEDCRFIDVFGENVYCKNEDSPTGYCFHEDCPLGHSKEELVAKISKEKELCRIDVNTVVSAILEER